MAFSVRKDILRSPVATGVQSTGGLGFQPKALLLWSDRMTTGSGTVAGVACGFGFATSSGAQFTVGVGADDAVATTNTAHRMSTKALQVLLDGTGSVQYDCDCSTLWSDGFNLNWSTTATSLWVHYLALGGTDLTNAKVGVFSLAAVTGTQTIGGVGFQPDTVLFLAANVLASQLGNSLANLKWTLGAAQSATKRWAWALTAADNQTMTTGVAAKRHQRADSCLVGLTDTATIDFQVDHTAMLTDGFSLNIIDAPASAYQIAYLALGGGTYAVDVFEKSGIVGANSQAVTVGFSAAGLLLATWQDASATTITAHAMCGIGAGDFSRAGTVWQGVEDLNLSNANRRNDIVAVLQVSSAAGLVTLWTGSLTGRVESGFNLMWTAQDSVLSQIGYFAFGDTVVAAPTFIFRNRERTQLRM